MSETGVTVHLVNELRSKYGFSPSKALGQNFLVDANIAKKIASHINENVLEIGPGLGSLTLFLSQNSQKVVAVEYDKYLINPLAEVLEQFDANNVEVINEDIMQVEISKLSRQHNISSIAGNLPYNISASLLVDIAIKNSEINNVVAMVQKEVALRLCAPQKTRNVSAATLKIQFFMDASVAFDVSRKSFYPPPNVDSTVMLLTRKQETPPIPYEQVPGYFDLIDTAFSQRRKMLRKSLSSLFGDRSEEIFENASIPPTLRPEQCGHEEFLRLYNSYKDKI